MSGRIGECLWCGGEHVRMVPNSFLGATVREHMPDAMAVMCLRCSRIALVARMEPHGLRGSVRDYEDVMGRIHQEVFLAEDGEMIVSPGEEVS